MLFINICFDCLILNFKKTKNALNIDKNQTKVHQSKHINKATWNVNAYM